MPYLEQQTIISGKMHQDFVWKCLWENAESSKPNLLKVVILGSDVLSKSWTPEVSPQSFVMVLLRIQMQDYSQNPVLMFALRSVAIMYLALINLILSRYKWLPKICDTQCAYLRMAVALVNRRICWKEVKILLSICVPDMDTIPSLKHHRKGSIIVCPKSVLPLYILQSKVSILSAVIHPRGEAFPD